MSACGTYRRCAAEWLALIFRVFGIAFALNVPGEVGLGCDVGLEPRATCLKVQRLADCQHRVTHHFGLETLRSHSPKQMLLAGSISEPRWSAAPRVLACCQTALVNIIRDAAT